MVPYIAFVQIGKAIDEYNPTFLKVTTKHSKYFKESDPITIHSWYGP